MSEKLLPLAATGLVLVLSGVSGISLLVALDAQKKNEAQAVTIASQDKLIEGLTTSLNQSYGKLMELDAGMIAMAKIQRLDGEQLSKVMALELAEMRRAATPPKDDSAPALKVKAEVQPSGVAQRSESQQVGKPSSREQAPAMAQTIAPAPAPAPASADVGSAPVDASNPFEELLAEAAAEDKTKAPEPAKAKPEALTVAQATPLTMEKIDTLLVQRVSANWVKPSEDVTGLRTELLMKMGRDGSMASVELTKSSGNKAFDSSAVVALKNIGRMPEVAQVDQSTYEKAYKSRSIVFSPEMLGN